MTHTKLPEGWTPHKLGELFDFKNGLNAEKEKYGQGIKFINVMEIFNHDVILGDDIKGEVQASEKHIGDYLVKFGDVLFNRTSETHEEIALSSVYMDNKPVVFGGFVIRARPKTKRLLPKYCIYLFNVAQIRKEFIRRSQGVIRANIGQGDLRLVSLSIPPQPEQKVIAEILSTWDRGIEQLSALLAAKRERKCALMQRLLTGKLRFSEFVKSGDKRSTKFGDLPLDWDYVPIGKIATHVSIKNVSGTEFPVLSCTKRRGLVDSMKYFGKQVYSKDLSTYKIVKRGTFAYATNHIEEGSIGYQDLYESAVISPMYTVFKTNGSVNDDFLFRLLKTELYRHIFEVNTSASVDRRGSLRWPEFQKIHVALPPLAEQTRIAAILSAADREIDQLTQKLDTYKQQKKGLMQQLLTGKKRVKLRDDLDSAETTPPKSFKGREVSMYG